MSLMKHLMNLIKNMQTFMKRLIQYSLNACFMCKNLLMTKIFRRQNSRSQTVMASLIKDSENLISDISGHITKQTI